MTHGLGLHFFNNAPAPSGQQYTGISVAQAAIARIPESEINNNTDASTIAAAPQTVCGETCPSQSLDQVLHGSLPSSSNDTVFYIDLLSLSMNVFVDFSLKRNRQYEHCTKTQPQEKLHACFSFSRLQNNLVS
jgi:hypothetical protein